jgi:alpha-tubulin suppressor-like RCC1 family protein
VNSIKRGLWILGGVLLLAGLCSRAPAYDFIRNNQGDPLKWNAGPITMQLRLGSSPTLSDGSNPNSSVQAAMQQWNAQIGNVQFNPQVSSGGAGDGNGSNEIIFSSDIFGDAFDSQTLAITTVWLVGTRRAEADIIFNTAWTWDSYRGSLAGHVPEDIQRVAIHELGHVLGLDHPDQASPPQDVPAIMNSAVSNIDALRTDDMAGAQFLYGNSGGSGAPGNNDFANASTITLSGNSAQASGTTAFATKEPGEPNHADNAGGASVWWRWTAPSDGSMTITTAGSNFDTVLGIYTGGSVSGLSTIASNDDVQTEVVVTSTVTFNASSGATYYIAVDGWDGDNGLVTMNLNFTPAVVTTPYIITHPQNTTAVQGASMSFTAAAGGDPAPYANWQVSTNGGGFWQNMTATYPYSGVFTNTLTITFSNYPMSGYQYRCVFTSSAGSVTTNVATLTVQSPPIAPGAGGTLSLFVGETANFSIGAGGTPPFFYQWQRNGVDIPGATSATYSLPDVQLSDGGTQFRAIVTNAFGSATGAPTTLQVVPFIPLSITAQPQGLLTYVGSTLSMSVSTVGSRSPTNYQWRKNGVNISAPNGPALTLFNIQTTDAGDYSVVVSNNLESVTSAAATISVVATPGAIRPSSGLNHTLFLGSDGSMWGMGTNAFGELGLGLDVSGTVVPQRVLIGVTDISAGRAHSLFIKSDRTLWATGFSAYGQLGDGSNQQRRTVPVQVATGTVQAAAGGEFSMMLKADLTLWATGNNSQGQLGIGFPMASNIWVQVATDVVWIAAGREHGLFVKRDGTLWAMGRNDSGQLGDGTTTRRTTPVQVATNVRSCFAGSFDSYFIKNDGSLWGMGLNGWGELGDGSFAQRTSPVSIATNVASVAAGDVHTVFVKTDGTLWAMGDNTHGQLGIGSTTASNVPQLVASGVSAASAGGGFSTFTKSDGGYWGQGLNNSTKQLGINSNTTYQLPVLILSGPLLPPDAPSNLAASDRQFHGGVKLDWSPVLGALSYEVWRGTTNNSAAATRIAEGLSIPLFYDSTIAPAVTHYFWIKARNPAGTSGFSGEAAAATADGPPVITSQPSSSSFFLGSNAIFQVAATSVPVLSFAYQWQRLPSGSGVWADLAEGSGYAGTTTTTLVVANTVPAMTGDRFRCVVTNTFGAATSNAATLTLIIPPPTIYDQPLSQTVAVGSPITLSVTATSQVTLSYQWRKNGTNIPGANSSTYTIPSAQVGDSGSYLVAIFSAGGSAVSTTATVLVIAPPVITNYPGSSTGYYGQTIGFTVTATGAAPLSFVWRKNGTPIPGATNDTFFIVNAQAGDAADYSVTVSNVDGSVTSDTATLTLRSPVLPVFTVHPQPRAITPGMTTTFTIAVTGEPVPMLQWQWLPAGSSDWANIGLLGGTLTVSGGSRTSLSNNGDQYRCVATNLAGSVTSNPAWLTVAPPPGAVMVAGGNSHTQFLRMDGTRWAMGHNAEGQIGDGTGTERLSPVAGSTDVVGVAAGSDHALFVKQDGSLWVHGSNGLGALGTGNLANVSNPVQIASGVAAAAAGHRHSLFRKTDGTLWAMGSNAYGQLGNGTTTDQSTPVQVAAHVVNFSAGLGHSLVVKSDGTAWAFGWNIYGQLGDNTTISRSVPVQVATNAAATASGFYYSVLLKTDGTVWAIGRNDQGQLGDSTTTDRTAWVQVATNVTAIATGYAHSVFLKADGTLWVTGSNDSGQLGTDTPANRSTPVQVASNVVSVSAGLQATFFIKADGTLWGMGANYQGQLGDGTTTGRVTAVQIAAGTLLVPGLVGTVNATNNASADRVQLTWSPVLGAMHYEVWRSTTNDSGTATRIASRVVGAYHEDLTGTSGVNYYYWIKAVGPAGTNNFAGSTLGYWGAVLVAPTITTQPASQTVNLGANVTFSVVASGSTPFAYQWRKGSSPIGSATGSSYTINNAAAIDSGSYDVVVTNAAGSATSDTAVLTVGKLPQTITFAALADREYPGPAFLLMATASSGLPVSFEVVSGPATVSGNILTPTGTGTITVRAAQAGNATYQAAAPVERSFATMGRPVITAASISPERVSGPGTVTLTATVSAAGTPVFQWYRVVSETPTEMGNAIEIISTPLAGANSTSVTVPIGTQAQKYWLRVTNAGGMATTDHIRVVPWFRHDPLPQIFNARKLGSLYVGVGGHDVSISSDGRTWARHAFITESYLHDIAEGGGIHVAVGERGIYSSPDLSTWTRRSVPAGGDYNGATSICHGNGRFVAVGSAGRIDTSTDGVNWTQLPTPEPTLQLLSVIHDGTRFIAAGRQFNAIAGGSGPDDVGVIYTSEDGLAWTLRTTSPRDLPGSVFTTLVRVAKVGGKYLAVGPAPAVMVSDDGLTWARHLVNEPGGLTAIGMIGDRLVVAGGSQAHSSTDTITWTKHSMPAAGGADTLLALPHELIALGGSGAAYATVDGIEWFVRQGVFTDDNHSVAYGAGRFVSLAGHGLGHTSLDGRIWTRLPQRVAGQSSGITYGLNRFFATEANVNGRLWTSSDGLAWSAIQVAGVNDTFSRILTAGDRIFARAGGQDVRVTSDGLSWAQTDPGVTSLDGVAFGNDIYVGVGNGIATSPDGLTWTPTAQAVPGHLYGVAYGNNRFVAVGGGMAGLVYTSGDGVSWTQQNPPGAGSGLSGILFADGRFVLRTGDGLYFSAEGESWTALDATSGNLRDVTAGNGTLVAVGWGYAWSSAPTSNSYPEIVTAPGSITAVRGRRATLAVEAAGNELSYVWSRGGVPLVDGPKFDGVNTARLIIADMQPGDTGDYTVAVSRPRNVDATAVGTINLGQSITFAPLANTPYTTDPITLVASADSLLTVTFSVVSGPATLEVNSLTLTGTGLVTVRAIQAGDGTYAAAPVVERSFLVTGNIDSWQLSKFTAGELLDANISGPNADPDHDGFGNLLEYALGLEPKSASTIGLPTVSVEGSDWVYTITRPADVTGVAYAFEVSTNLVNWSTLPPELVGGNGTTETWRAKYPLASAPNCYFRLKVAQ